MAQIFSGGKQAPAKHADGSWILHGNPELILQCLDFLPALLEGKLKSSKGNDKSFPPLTAADLTKLSEKPEEDIHTVLYYFGEMMFSLNQKSSDGMIEGGNSRVTLLSNAAHILKQEPWAVYQLYACMMQFENDGCRDLFLQTYLPRMGMKIYWEPFITDLQKYNDADQVRELFFGKQLKEYTMRWHNTAVVAEEAIFKLGLDVASMFTPGIAKHMEVLPHSEQVFMTMSSGKTFIPPYIADVSPHLDNATEADLAAAYQSNLSAYRVGVQHEFGHHEWKTFELNMNPSIFDYGSFGLEFVYFGLAEKRGESWNRILAPERGDPFASPSVAKGAMVRRKSNGELIMLTRFEDVTGLVKYPFLLGFIHNVLDDGRVDANNICAYPGLAKEYRRKYEDYAAKRPNLEDDSLGMLLEAILQQAILGRIKGKTNPMEFLATAGQALSAAGVEEHEDLFRDLKRVTYEMTDDLDPFYEWLAQAKQVVGANPEAVASLAKAEAMVPSLVGTVPEGMKDRFEKAKEIIRQVEFGPDTDGTSSMNAAIRIYLMLEQELEEELKKASESSYPENFNQSKTKIGGQNAPKIIYKAKPGEQRKKGQPGINPLEFAQKSGSGQSGGEQSSESEGSEGAGEATGKPTSSSAAGKPGPKSGGDPRKAAGGQTVGSGHTTEGSSDGSGTNIGNKSEEDDGEPAGDIDNLNHGRRNAWTPSISDGAVTEAQAGPFPEQTFLYDGFNGHKLERNVHIVVEQRAEGGPLIMDQSDERRIESIFRRYTPKVGVLVRGTKRGRPDPQLYARWDAKLHEGVILPPYFRRKVLYEERDVATGVIVDLSGSESHVRDEVFMACAVLSKASHVLGDPCVVAGFAGGTGDERFILMKDTWERMARGTSISGGTPMAGPLRHMAHKLDQPGIGHKFYKQIFFITDGEANCGGADAMADIAYTVKEIQMRSRIKIFGLGIYRGSYDEQRILGNFRDIFGFSGFKLIPAEEVKRGALSNYFEAYYRDTVHMLR